jgi:site-specific DNA-methyltransferase (adenine-specific)
MAEKVVIGNAELWHGDCREVLPLLPKHDLLLTDPPYELGVMWSGGFDAPNGKRTMWKGGPPEWDKLCADGLLPAVDKCAEAVVWGGHLYELPQRSRWLSWDKCQAFSGGDFELAWTSGHGATRVFRMSRIDAYQNSGEGKQHPTQKPSALMAWCLALHPKAQTVLDPFAGSGTTGVACAQLGKAFTGIERERRYFDIACERISRAQAQGSLLTPEPFGGGEQQAMEL